MTILLNFLHILSNIRNDDLSLEKVNFARLNSKLGHVNSRINFLLDCRSLQLTPAFILHKTSKLKYVPQTTLASKAAKLRLAMLNEEIRSVFRLKAYLQRRLDRSAEILQTDHNRWLWLLENRRLIFAEELRSGQDRLLTKLRNLSLQQHGIQLNCSRTHTYKRINWLVNNLLQDTSVHKMHHLSAKPVLDHKTEPVTFDTSVFSEYVSSDSNATRSGRDSWLKITRARLWFLSQSFMYSVRYRIQTILSRLISSFCKYSRVFREYTDSSVDKPPRKIISPDLPTTAADSHHAFQLPQTQPRLVNLPQRVIHPSTKDVLGK